jgi:hypothetical protein
MCVKNSSRTKRFLSLEIRNEVRLGIRYLVGKDDWKAGMGG